MWLKFDEIKFETGLTARSGNKYDAWILKGVKKGVGDTPDEDYQKILFDNSTCTVIEHGIERHNMPVVQFFQKAVKPGDLVAMKYSRKGKLPELNSVENLSNKGANEYVPLTAEQAAELKRAADAVPVAAKVDDTPPWVASK